MRRVGEIAGEMFREKHLALPALSVIQVGALPLEGAQVVIEATEVDRNSGESRRCGISRGRSGRTNVGESIEKLKDCSGQRGNAAGRRAGHHVLCELARRSTRHALTDGGEFPEAALDYVQMQRSPVMPAADCGAVARIRTAGAGAEIRR